MKKMCGITVIPGYQTSQDWFCHSPDQDDGSGKIIPNKVDKSSINFEIFLFQDANFLVFLWLAYAGGSSLLDFNLNPKTRNRTKKNKKTNYLLLSKLRQMDEIPLDHVTKVRPAGSQDLFNSEIAQFRHKVIAGLNLKLGKFNIHNFRLKNNHFKV